MNYSQHRALSNPSPLLKMPEHHVVLCLWPHQESQIGEVVSAHCSSQEPAMGVQGYGTVGGGGAAQASPCPLNGKAGPSEGPRS